MPKTGSLPEQASAAVGEAAYSRESHEMRNGADEAYDVDRDAAYGHKPIERGSMHREKK
jgi:hypothetical protein